MKRLIICTLFVIPMLTLAQNISSLKLGIANVLSYNYQHKYGANPFYYKNILQIGYSLNEKHSTFDFNILYQYSISKSCPENKKIKERDHFLGLGMNLHFGNKIKRFRVIFGIQAYFNIYSNYKYRYLWEDYLIPKEEPHILYTSLGFIKSYDGLFYISTPFIGNIFLGCDFKVFKRFHLILSIGYGYRIINTKRVHWSVKEDPSIKLSDASIISYELNMVNYKLSLTYSFSLKKKPNLPL